MGVELKEKRKTQVQQDKLKSLTDVLKLLRFSSVHVELLRSPQFYNKHGYVAGRLFAKAMSFHLLLLSFHLEIFMLAIPFSIKNAKLFFAPSISRLEHFPKLKMEIARSSLYYFGIAVAPFSTSINVPSI